MALWLYGGFIEARLCMPGFVPRVTTGGLAGTFLRVVLLDHRTR